jgi:hypothetical protein
MNGLPSINYGQNLDLDSTGAILATSTPLYNSNSGLVQTLNVTNASTVNFSRFNTSVILYTTGILNIGTNPLVTNINMGNTYIPNLNTSNIFNSNILNSSYANINNANITTLNTSYILFLNNIEIGQNALYSNTTGINNIANGSGALYSNITGNNNIAIGLNSMSSNISGFNNTAIGSNTYINASYSTAIGYNASTSTNNQIILGTSSENVFIPGTITLNSAPLLSYSTLSIPGDNQIGYIKGGTLTTNTTTANTDTQMRSLSLNAGVWSVLGSAVFPPTANNSSFIGLSISPFTNASDPICQQVGLASINTSTGLQINRYIQNTATTSYYLIARTTGAVTCSYINMSALRIA